MKRIFTAVLLTAIILGDIYLYRQPYFGIETPEKIVLQKGEHFSLDDYVKIDGGEGICIEYIDDININREGSYSLRIKAQDAKGRIKEKEVEVIVEDAA
ncbi:MAG: hypothetical protein PUD43_03735 [Clostridia bacterium]|nr:hypothetical protein [Clostridia bacterium]